MEKAKMLMLLPAKALSMGKKGQVARSNVIGLVIAVILVVSVAIPVTEDAVNNSTATGTTRTVLNLLTLFLAIGLLVLIAAGSGLI